MRKVFVVVGAAATAAPAGVVWWRNHPRSGSRFVNQVIDPWLVRKGVIDKSHGEIGLLEHVGRRTGIVRVSPVHPVVIEDGFRIIVPLGLRSEWARNVVAAGRCRIQIGNGVHDAGEPALVEPSAADGLGVLTARLMSWLGFRYLRVRRLATHAGTLNASPGV